MLKKSLFFIIIILSCFINVSCNKSSQASKAGADFEIFYSGFIPVDSRDVSEYAMKNYYIITKKEDWDEWNQKYTAAFPYYLDDSGMDWDKECLIVYAYTGAKDGWNVMHKIENVSFDNNLVNIDYNDDGKTEVFAFNNGGIYQIGLYVIKVDKPSNLSALNPIYFHYYTYSQQN